MSSWCTLIVLIVHKFPSNKSSRHLNVGTDKEHVDWLLGLHKKCIVLWYDVNNTAGENPNVTQSVPLSLPHPSPTPTSIACLLHTPEKPVSGNNVRILKNGEPVLGLVHPKRIKTSAVISPEISYYYTCIYHFECVYIHSMYLSLLQNPLTTWNHYPSLNLTTKLVTWSI